jgi:uncharacterized protein (TIGR02246 family)
VHLFPAAIAAVALVASPAAAADNSADETAIKGVFTAFRDSWNTPGMPGFEKLFLPDADFVVISGKWLHGRDEIVSYHRDLLKTFYAGSRLFVDNVSVRFTRDDEAVAHIAFSADYEAEGKSARRTALATSTLRKVGGVWLIETFHNTLTGGPGYAFTRPASLPSVEQ